MKLFAKAGALLFVGAGALAASPSVAVAQAPRVIDVGAVTADAFWLEFRSDIVEKSTPIDKLPVADTLVQRGPLDDSPGRKLRGAARFKAVAAALDARTGLSAKPQSQRDLIVATAQPTARMKLSPTDLRVGDMLFQRSTAGWRLTTIYLDD